MAADGALEIFPQVQALVLDKLQVVSYKWLSRNFSVSSNYAKRLIQEFAERHCSELEVIYTLSGWLKSEPQTYCVKLASTHKLEAKQVFKDNCSVQVYSVQACVPNDLAVIWNAEFVQAEELFNQPLTEGNCLRDNRFCGVSNSFVKRIVDGKHVGAAAPWPMNGKGVAIESKGISTVKGQPVQHPQQGSGAKNGMQSSIAVSSDNIEKVALDAASKVTKPPLIKESVSGGNAGKNKGQNVKSSSGTASSLASLWGNASAKSKPVTPAAETAIDTSIAAATAEAQICAREALDAANSEDEDHHNNHKRERNGVSGRKRRVFLDFSDDDDEEENVTSLSSPDVFKGKHAAESLPKTESLLERSKLSTAEPKGDRLSDGLDGTEGKNSSLPSDADERSASITMGGISLKKKTKSYNQGDTDKNNKDVTTTSTSTSPKRRKVLKTRIDNRGREVTEVIWEGETADSNMSEKNISVNDAANRPPVANKAQAAGIAASTNPGKGGNKKPGKGGPKDAKQGNILSFFKRV
ncbi:DNA polymerase subunit Cdc27 [Musa troglodytarum]|uniref:DNA polymerase delta subunit 3 n=1 Tax=Musa troglodytarum TaxID=320322 RepID=A0A9E7GBF2_9LILI|nr:DNA polymerase subunit Cdc27 [Musa troglodytarum]